MDLTEVKTWKDAVEYALEKGGVWGVSPNKCGFCKVAGFYKAFTDKHDRGDPICSKCILRQPDGDCSRIFGIIVGWSDFGMDNSRRRRALRYVLAQFNNSKDPKPATIRRWIADTLTPAERIEFGVK